jgi:hypothetical protein
MQLLYLDKNAYNNYYLRRQALFPIITPKSSGEGKEKRASILTTGKMTGFAGNFLK